MSLHLERRRDGGLALYIDGDLQFDTADEAVYHESLVLPALCLLRNRRGERGESAFGFRVLICGGGDGLALREALRFPGVTSVDLVDYDPDVVILGSTELAEANRDAYADPRVRVHIADAWEFTESCGRYDAVICDLTVPRRPEEARVFSREWYARLKSVIADDGLLAINGFSPERTPEAFWCLRRTVRAAGLSALPYRVCIPSFRAHGYGAWAFLLASPTPLRQRDLRNLACPVSTQQADLDRLWRGARFRRPERALGRRAPVHTLDAPALFPLLLNPGGNSAANLPDADQTDFDLDPLIASMPVLHPYHTREMVEALAEQVVGSIRSIDVRRLVQALLRRAAELPRSLFAELLKLRDYLRDHAPDLSRAGAWGFRLFAALVIVMTVANAISPDNAFGKGGSGIGHSSFSRGFSVSHGPGVRGGFGGGRGGGESFGSAHSYSAPRISGSAFRSGWGHGYASDIFGFRYRPRVFVFSSHTHYYGGYNRSTAQASAPPQREEHRALFVADDDLMVLDNGDVVITLSDTAYLLVNEGRLDLYSVNSLDPLVGLHPEPALFTTIAQDIREQQSAARHEVSLRRDWLSWVGWTSALFPAVRDDKTEVRNLQDLDKRLTSAAASIGQPPAGPATVAPPDSTELFTGAFLLPGGTVTLHGTSGWQYTDGKTLWTGSQDDRKDPKTCPPELAAVLRSVLTKLQKELTADISSLANDAQQLTQDRASLDKDLAEYQRLQSSYGSSYEVDYGTDTMSASQAISKTNADIAENQRDVEENAKERAKSRADLDRITLYLPGFGK